MVSTRSTTPSNLWYFLALHDHFEPIVDRGGLTVRPRLPITDGGLRSTSWPSALLLDDTPTVAKETTDSDVAIVAGLGLGLYQVHQHRPQ